MKSQVRKTRRRTEADLPVHVLYWKKMKKTMKGWWKRVRQRAHGAGVDPSRFPPPFDPASSSARHERRRSRLRRKRGSVPLPLPHPPSMQQNEIARKMKKRRVAVVVAVAGHAPLQELKGKGRQRKHSEQKSHNKGAVLRAGERATELGQRERANSTRDRERNSEEKGEASQLQERVITVESEKQIGQRDDACLVSFSVDLRPAFAGDVTRDAIDSTRHHYDHLRVLELMLWQRRFSAPPAPSFPLVASGQG